METFSALLAIYAGNSPVTGEFPSQRAVTRSFDVFFDLRLNERLSKQSCGWWSETQSRPSRPSGGAVMSKTKQNNTVGIFYGPYYIYDFLAVTVPWVVALMSACSQLAPLVDGSFNSWSTEEI